MPELPKAYTPHDVEGAIYERWLAADVFAPDGKGTNPDPILPPFVIIQPPPNITGALHLGHALTFTLEDAMIRHARMQGHETLWLPGLDHAHLDALEEEAIFILREVAASFERPALLFSGGKDSCVVLRLAEKAFKNHVAGQDFAGRLPFPGIRAPSAYSRLPARHRARHECQRQSPPTACPASPGHHAPARDPAMKRRLQSSGARRRAPRGRPDSSAT